MQNCKWCHLIHMAEGLTAEEVEADIIAKLRGH